MRASNVPDTGPVTRRALVAGGVATAGAGLLLGERALSHDKATLPPLKSTVSYPLGVCAKFADINDPAWADLAARNFSRLTPEWEMKMEYILQKDGSLQFDRPDALLAFANSHGMTMHGHTLIWYAEDGEMFQRLKGKPDAFLNAYVDYIHGVVGHYRGRLSSWDVVNEPIMDDGSALRDCLWSQQLGADYVGLALTAAHQADPNVPLFINDYYLERTPAKRKTFLKLCETVLKNGAPLHGIGTQSHMYADLTPGAITASMRDLVSLGLKIHVSEVDISLQESRPTNIVQPKSDQMRVLDELMQAWHDVPAHQKHALTFWGLRDSDSWINHSKGAPVIPDQPLLFNPQGQPKPLTEVFLDAAR